MLLIPNRCPKCFGHLILDKKNMTLVCEDCGEEEEIKKVKDLELCLELSEEWGPQEKRFDLTLAGTIIWEAWENSGKLTGLGEFMGKNLDLAIKGLIEELEGPELEQLKKGGLIKWQ